MSKMNIFEKLTEVVKAAAAQGGTKAAIEAPPTSAPVGKATDPTETTPTEGAVAAENKANSQASGGVQGVDNTSAPLPDKSKNNASQVATTTASDPPPSDIKPSATIEQSGTDSDTKSAAISSEIANLIARSTAILPKEAAADKKDESKPGATPKEGEGKKDPPAATPPSGEAPTGAPADCAGKCSKAAADQMQQAEAYYQQKIASYLTAAGMNEKNTQQEKLAAVTNGILADTDKMVMGFLISMDPAVMTAAIKQAAEGNPVMPEAAPGGDAPPSAGMDPGAGAAPGGAPGAEGAGGDAAMQQILALIQKAESGEIPMDQLPAALQELGMSPEDIQALMQAIAQAQAGGGAAPGGAAPGGGAAPEASPSQPGPGESGEEPKVASVPTVAQLKVATAALVAALKPRK